MNYYLSALKKYAVFSGRAKRAEYWYFFLFNSLFGGVLYLLSVSFGDLTLYILYLLVFFVPGLALSIRRLHDVGKSGSMFLIILIPYVGAIWLLILLARDGDPGKNKYGPSPKVSKDTKISK